MTFFSEVPGGAFFFFEGCFRLNLVLILSEITSNVGGKKMGGKMGSNQEVQADYKKRMADQGFRQKVVWLNSTDLEIIKKWRKKIKLTSASKTISYLLCVCDRMIG